MRRPQPLIWIAAGLLALAVAGPGRARPAAHARATRVVELFTAQGCSDCLGADQALAGVARRKGVVVLTWPVDYWDYEGWTDTFAEPAFSERQRAYARRLKVREIYTPEVVVDGAHEASALDRPAVEALLKADPPSGPAPRLKLSEGGTRVRIAPAPRRAAGTGRGEVWLVRYDPKPRTVRVKSGDNRGKTVVESNVVRELTRLGPFAGAARSYALPPAAERGLQAVVLLQAPHGGRILAAAPVG